MKKLVKKKTGGENPKLTIAKQDSARAKKFYDNEYNKALKNPNGKPPSQQFTESTEKKMSKPAQVRKELGIKKMGGATKTKSKK